MTISDSKPKSTYLLPLDGIRGLAIISVLFCHLAAFGPPRSLSSIPINRINCLVRLDRSRSFFRAIRFSYNRYSFGSEGFATIFQTLLYPPHSPHFPRILFCSYYYYFSCMFIFIRICNDTESRVKRRYDSADGAYT